MNSPLSAGAQVGEMPEEMTDDSKTIGYYGASNGGEIIVDEIDENAAGPAFECTPPAAFCLFIIHPTKNKNIGNSPFLSKNQKNQKKKSKKKKNS
jgi:hypothetical protein